MSGDNHNQADRCYHFWRWQHRYLRGWHCNACCVTFDLAKYPTTGTSREVSS